MNAFRLPKLITLLPLAAALALGTLLRAEDPPAPPPPDKKPEAVQPAPAQPEAAPAPATPAPAAKVETPAPADATEVAEQMAEKARAEADRIAEQARANAEKVAEQARLKAEQTAAEAQAHAEQARRNAEKVAADARDQVAAAAEAAAQAEQQSAEDTKQVRRHIHANSSNQGDRVIIMDDNVVAAGTTVAHDAVAVMGNLTVEGEVMHDAVAVMGNNTINGTVHHDVVAVMGNIDLGPKAVVHGNIVSVGGEIHRDPGAVVDGHTNVQAIGGKFNAAQLTDWWTHGLKLGRPLAFGAHLAWLWIFTAFSVAFYALLGLVLPGKVRACGDKLAQEPGMAILAGLLGVLGLPVLFVLLFITIIGIPVALLMLPVATLLIAMFGKAAIYCLVGRRLSGDRLHPALAVILGALLFVLLYLLPVVGLLLSLLVWFLGFGCAVLAIFSKAPKAAPAAPAPTAPPVAPASAGLAAAGLVAAPVAPAGEPSTAVPPVAEPPPVAAVAPAPAPAPTAPVPLTAYTLPRAGFLIRVAAAFLDFVMICIPCGILGLFRFGPGLPFLLLVAYHAAMWVHKGTTIGGIICGLKVVRLDDKPIDWGVAVVRALTGFLSFIMAGLGFIWVAFDDGKQSWHDKVAGTTIVRVPKGTPLL